jgi:hypothetical protein
MTEPSELANPHVHQLSIDQTSLHKTSAKLGERKDSQKVLKVSASELQNVRLAKNLMQPHGGNHNINQQ